MKSKKQVQTKVHSQGGKGDSSQKPEVTISIRRLWLFRIFTIVVVPLVVIGGLELGLRLFGFGYPTSFFLQSQINGKSYYVPNDCFGYRFFPPALARTPVPLRMAKDKPPGTIRIFLFGESAAQGDPDPTFGAGRYLQALLRERYPGTNFEVVCVAMTAINSHAILPIARECARYDGDLWIIYMGNNEMVGPFGASTVFGPRAPKTALVRADLAVKATRTGQLLDGLLQRRGAYSPALKTWGGLSMFKEQQRSHNDPSRLRAYDNFKKNLADILRAGRDAGVPIILSTVGSNLKDCAPFASLHATTLSEAQKTAWDGFFQHGVESETAGNYQDALEQFIQAANIDPQYAELQFRMGTCDLALTNASQALREFELSRDDDTLAFRADDRINEIIAGAADAQNGKGVYFLDAAQMLAKNSSDGIPGNELFYEHVHLNFAGNYLLGRAFAEQTAKALSSSLQSPGKGVWASAESCDRRLAVSPWDRYRVWQDNFSRVSEPPFTDQLNDVPRAKFYMAKLKDLSSQMNELTSKQARSMYQQAVESTPEDYFLHENFAQFLSEIGDLTAAITEEQQVGELLPQTPIAPYRIGSLFVMQGNIPEAEKSFLRVLAVRRDYVPALNELGLIAALRHDKAGAVKYFTQAIQLNPGYFETYLNWGFMEQYDGKWDQAAEHYRKAADLQSAGPASYFYQGVTLARAHRGNEAVKFLRGAVWANPKFWQARYILGMELVAAGNVAEAETQFSEVVRIRPDFARAHLNYGVALAKQRKLDDAMVQFKAALQLDPSDKVAQQNLGSIQANIQALKMRNQ